LAISDRDLSACQLKQLPADWRCTIAYNTALQAATAALAATGYRAARDNHHYRVIQSLEFTTGPSRQFIDTLDGFGKKRNMSSYDVAGAVSDKEADEMLKLATRLRVDVEKWIRTTRPELFKPAV
jgi:predicted DNA-binding ribbon-helix-helix protein